MKKLTISLLFVYALLHLSRAQTNNAPAAFGSASQIAGVNGDTSISFMIGQAIISNYVAAAQCHLGFPYDAQYMQNTFMGGLWASKGYYPDNVLLQWNIANNADQITGYTISRRLVSTTNTSFQVVATLDPSVMSWQDQYCETGTLYEYKVTAAGIPGVQKLNLTYVTAIGFRQPIGTATGRITYAGGTAVPDVSVLAQTNPAIPTSALGFDGVYGYMTIDETSHGSLTSQSGFTFQAWVKDTASSKTKLRFIFDKASVTRMWLDESKKSLVWVYGIDSVSLSFASVDSDYFHLSAVRNGNSLMIQLNDGKKVIQAKQTFNNFSTADKAGTFYIAQQLNSSNRFSGLIDEIRMWNIALDSATIQRDYQRVLSGTETGLEAYYQCNENVGNVAYDLTHTGNTYKGNDATLYNVRWTIYTPPLLVIKGITDSNGNYIISNIPYAAGGSTYTFTPMFGVHTFNPTQALRYFAPGSNVSNSVDFTDNSSFHVSGTVRYNNTNVPVQGVSVLVDGTMAIKNRAPVTSDANGLFKIDVPIGFHRITLSKQGHSFVDGFPTKNYVNANGNLDSLYDFENDIVSPITFYDSTLATIAGRVAGGIVQQAKPLGFGLSKSNPGYGKITLNLQSNGLLHSNPGDSVVNIYGNNLIRSQFVINQNKITIYPDTVTGEYAVQLPPGTYTVASAIAGNIANGNTVSFDNSFLGTINLDINKKDSSRYFFIDSVLVNKHKIAHFDSSIYRFNQRYDFILRNTPVIQVSQANQNFFGDSLIVFTDANNKPTDTLHLIKKRTSSASFPDTNVYYFGYPIFHQQAAYIFKIKVYEEYKNLVNGKVEDIPQIDGGTLVISNSLSNNTNISDTLDSNGSMVYNFAGGAQTLFHPLR